MMIMNHSHPTVQIPPWDFIDDDQTADIHSPFSGNAVGSPDSGVFDALTALQRYLPSNGRNDVDFDSGDAFSCDDHFRMYEFKVRLCARGRSHDWTECPYAHSGEKARRRDPRVYHYSGVSCPEFRKGHCKKGDACEYAHGVFECWLHPARYRTQPCKDGTHCRRRVCFFAHAPDQLRCVTSPSSYAESCDSFDGSPGRTRVSGLGFDSLMRKVQGLSLYSPPSSPPTESPPISPSRNPNNGLLAESMRKMRIGNLRMGIMSPPSWGLQLGGGGTGLFSPRSPSTFRPGFMSLPTTPTRNPTRSGLTAFDHWDKPVEEEPVMERVESGKDIRARMYAKLSKENSFDSGTDVGWVSELLK